MYICVRWARSCQPTLFWTVHHDLLSPQEGAGSKMSRTEVGKTANSDVVVSFLLKDFKMRWYIHNSIKNTHCLIAEVKPILLVKAWMLNTISEVDTPEIPRQNKGPKEDSCLHSPRGLRCLHNQSGAENDEEEMRTSWKIHSGIEAFEIAFSNTILNSVLKWFLIRSQNISCSFVLVHTKTFFTDS